MDRNGGLLRDSNKALVVWVNVLVNGPVSVSEHCGKQSRSGLGLGTGFVAGVCCPASSREVRARPWSVSAQGQQHSPSPGSDCATKEDKTRLLVGKHCAQGGESQI